MKTKITILALIALSIFSCKKNETSETEIKENRAPETPPTPVKECYLYTNKKDTLLANFTYEGTAVTGDLAYKFYEKDKSSGPVSGTSNGDTIFVDYTFQAEGTQSIREAVFLKKGNKLYEGHGDMEDKNGKMVFKDKTKLDFTGTLFLSKTDCK